eukprot:NODE_428_length_8761_cov_0.779612.p4 type:complete len:166 gc:universal NODE_428_length_8761_cov_0.779612:2359-1862(-)
MNTKVIDWVVADVRYKPNNRGNKITGTVPYNPNSSYCEEIYSHYNKIQTKEFAFYQPEDVTDNAFPTNIVHLMYNISEDRRMCEQHTKIVQHRIYEIYRKEVQRNERLWRLVDFFLDKESINNDLLKLVGQSDIYLYTLRGVLDGFSEIARLKAQYDQIIKKVSK